MPVLNACCAVYVGLQVANNLPRGDVWIDEPALSTGSPSLSSGGAPLDGGWHMISVTSQPSGDKGFR